MILFGGSLRLACTRRACVLREILAGALPAHPARMVSVRKCHEVLRRKGLLESHDSQRLLLYGETLLLRLHEMMMICGVIVKEVKVVLI
jgi:hypothetical protein